MTDPWSDDMRLEGRRRAFAILTAFVDAKHSGDPTLVRLLISEAAEEAAVSTLAQMMNVAETLGRLRERETGEPLLDFLADYFTEVERREYE